MGGAALARRRYANIFMATMVVIGMVMQSCLEVRALSLKNVLGADVAALAILCGCGAVWRKTLLQNALHRRI